LRIAREDVHFRLHSGQPASSSPQAYIQAELALFVFQVALRQINLSVQVPVYFKATTGVTIAGSRKALER
jgi:hypothetical protein